MPATPASPPKRMTRARAKAVEEKQNVKTIATPAARVAKSAAATKATKRKAPADEDGAEPVPALAGNRVKQNLNPNKTEMNAKPIKAPVRRVVRQQPEVDKEDPSSTKSKDNQKAAAPKPRGRPRKNTASQYEAPATAGPSQEIPTTRATRARAEANAKSSKAAPPARKKVTFQSDDKENIVVKFVPKPKAGKAVGRPTTAATRDAKKPAIRGAAAKPEETQSDIGKDQESRHKPLSPSKGIQTSVFTQPGSPMKESQSKMPAPSAPRTSPLKTLISKDDDVFGDSFDELQEVTTQNASPSRAMVTSIIGSPARRPPPSPFKDAMRTSPLRTTVNSGSEASEKTSRTFDESTMSLSPKKFNLAVGTGQPVFKLPQAQDMGKPLSQTSARRLASPLRAAERSTHASTPFSAKKRSMLQSPARRPPMALKSLGLSTPGCSDAASAPLTATGESAIRRSPQKISSIVNNARSSPLKARQTPVTGAPVHRMTSEEQAAYLMDELKRAPSPFSPMEHASMPSDSPASPVGALPSVIANVSELTRGSPLAFPLDEEGLFNGSPVSAEQAQARELDEEESFTPRETPVDSFQFKSPTLQWGSEDESEDELQNQDPRYHASPERRKSRAFLEPKGLSTPATNAGNVDSHVETSKVTMTTLAHKFGAWTGASPDQQVLERRKQERSLFSPVQQNGTDESVRRPEPSQDPAAQLPSSFIEAMDIREDEDELMPDAPDNMEEIFRQSQISDASQEYGDENAVPVDTNQLQAILSQTTALTPARLRAQPRQHVIHTTSKVPLKPAADDSASPLAVAKTRRSHSLSVPLTASTDDAVDDMINRRILAVGDQETDALLPTTPKNNDCGWSTAGTPAQTPRSNVNPNLLSGAVVHVDVHTTEGADASGIFVDLLAQMGAKCVKQWGWTPVADGSEQSAGDSRVGITHVVFKDGGKRTMEKVRQAKSVVQCVGVGWVLDCERENKWLDESDYAVDVSTIPRGGHRRRKSMEPRLLSNSNGTLSSRNTPAKLAGSLSPPSRDISPSQQFLNLVSTAKSTYQRNTPAQAEDRRVSFAVESPASAAIESGALPNNLSLPATPEASPLLDRHAAFDTPKPREMCSAAEGSGPIAVEYSPTTPYFLHGPSQLVQQTCPPKQTQQLLFPISGRIEEQEDAKLRQRLILARRKSMQFAPKVKSPLAKGFGNVL